MFQRCCQVTLITLFVFVIANSLTMRVLTLYATATQRAVTRQTVLVPLQNIKQISAGYWHTCALTTTGGVKCWGANGFGQLGDGTNVNKAVPIDVSGLQGGVSAIAAGNIETCALTNAGGVKCWGDNRDGLLGDGTAGERLTPVDVSGLSSGISALVAGGSHRCVLTMAGGVKCWGLNLYGELGDGTMTSHSTPVDVPGLEQDVIALAAGYWHTCALTTGGGVKCWGWNRFGQLGNGSTSDRWVPTHVTGLTTGVKAITANGYHTCALTQANQVKCWGDNGSGQLGNGTQNVQLTAVNVSGLNNDVDTIVAGYFHTCALTNTGAVQCWGANEVGQLSNDDRANHLTAVSVSGLSDHVIRMLAAGWNHTCALTNTGRVQCWGSNGSGQLGDGAGGNKSTPVKVSGLSSNISTMTSGEDYTCALTTIGTVHCWGANHTGQLGDSTTTGRAMPAPVSSLNSSIAAIAAGDMHTCALTNTGGVLCWGANYSGQLGDNSGVSFKATPVAVSGLSSRVTAITAGEAHTCALTSSGILCWGANTLGQLGDSTTASKPTPVSVTGLSNGIVAISAGDFHTCALTNSGSMQCWGDNRYGQLGDGTTLNKATPVAVSGLDSAVTAITAGDFHTCALTVSGDILCWGANGSGQLGDGTTVSKAMPVVVSGLSSGMAAVTAGGVNTCGLTSAGGVRCWGYNSSGQLGDGLGQNKVTPIVPSGLNSAISIIAPGHDHTCALTDTGDGLCWGANSAGQLGDGNAWSTTPQDVMEAAQPDLTITDIVVEEVGVPTCGSAPYNLPRVARVTAYNGGRAAAGAFTVSLNNIITQTVPSGLAAGAATVIEFSSGFQNGDNQVGIDSNAQVQEGDENNNTFTKYIWTPIATPLPTCTPTSIITDTPTPTPTTTPTPMPPANALKAWTMLLYLAGDTGRIDGGNVFNELKKAIRRLELDPNETVNVVALLDGAGDLDTFRVTFTPQARYTPLGEMPMDDPQTLVNFVNQAKRDFPAHHYYLVIADHANGVQGIAWDTTTDYTKKALLTPAKLETAFKTITEDGKTPIDVLHFDGCSFGLLENVATIRNTANYIVMSENIGWSLFAYERYRAAISAQTTPSEFAHTVAQVYAEELQKRPLPYTISAVDTRQLSTVLSHLNTFTDNLIRYVGQGTTERTAIETLRNVSQKFDSTTPLLEITTDDWYVDLVDFANRVQRQINDTALQESAQGLITNLKTGSTPLVIFEAHHSGSIDSAEECVQSSRVWDLNQSNGVSIYYPPKRNSTIFNRYVNAEIFPYFSQQTRWANFLQQGLLPLAPGDPGIDDLVIPLAPCTPSEKTVENHSFLPIIRR